MNVSVTGTDRPPPQVWHVPEPRRAGFIGRESVLLSLREQLEKHRVAALTEMPGHSRGGMGKTTTARQFVELNRRNYSHVIWLQGYSEHDLRTSLRELAEKLDWPQRHTADDVQLQAVFVQWLQQERDWLLVVDEVRQPAALSRILVPGLSGHVLLTSRRSELQTLGVRAPVLLSPFSEREAVEFLRQHVGRDIDDDELEAVRQLADVLGYYPLALELAATFMAQHVSRFQDYLAEFQQRRQLYLEQEPIGCPEYSPEVAVTVRLLGEAVHRAAPAAAELALLFSSFRPTGIPAEIFLANPDWFGPTSASLLREHSASPLRLDRCLAPLVQYGLLRRDSSGQRWQMHRVVQAALWNSQSLEQQREILRRQVGIINEAWQQLDANSQGTAEGRERLFPQALSAAKLCTAWGMAAPSAITLLRSVGDEFAARGRPGEAIVWYREAVHLLRESGGDDHSELPQFYQSIAHIFESQGNPERALPRLERSVEILAATGTADNAELRAQRKRLAQVYTQCGNYEAAVAQWEQILEEQERSLPSLAGENLTARERLADLYCTLNKPAFAEALIVHQLALLQGAGPEHRADLARTRVLLARILQNLGKLTEAERLLLPMQQEPCGSTPAEQLQRADILNRLALVTAARGEYAKAEEWQRAALAAREAYLAPDDPVLAITYNDLAEACFPQGKLEEAENRLQAALRIQKSRLARLDPQLARTRNNLAALLAAMGDHSRAEQLFLEDLQFKREALGTDHPHVATTLNNLGVVYGLLRRPIEEEAMFHEALSIREAALGEEHPQSAQSLCQLGQVWARQGKYIEAEPLLRRALQVRQKLLVAGHPDQAWAANALAEVALQQELRGIARPLLEGALAQLEQKFPETHPQLGVVLANLGNALRLDEDFEQSEACISRALRILDQPGAASPALIRTLVARGLLEKDRRQLDAAQQTLQRALHLQEQCYGSDSLELCSTLRRLGECAVAREQFSLAEQYLQRAKQLLRQAKRSRHPELVACGALLAMLRISLDDPAAAIELLAETSQAVELSLADPMEPAVLKWLHPLADAYFQLRNLPEAERWWRQQLDLTEKTLGPDHMQLTAPLEGLSKLCYSQQRFREAEAYLVRCLQINETHRDKNHPEVARTVENLAGLYFLQDRYVEAEPLIQRALAHKERTFGRRNAKVADALDNYAALLRKTGRPEQAEECESRAANIRLKHEHILGDLF